MMHVIMALKSAGDTKTKDGCKLCSCTAIVNGFKIGLVGTVERARRQKLFLTRLGHSQTTENKST